MDILNLSGKLKKIYLMSACLFLFSGIIFFPQPCRADIVKVDVDHLRDQYSAGRSYPVVFSVRISKQWYIHGTGTSDFMIPTELSFSGLSGITIEEIRFPEPEKKKFEYSEEPVEVFSGDIEISARLVVSEKAPIGEQVLIGQLFFQACSLRVCRPPEKLPIRINLSVVSPEKDEKSERPAVLESEKDAAVSEAPVPGWMAGAGFWLTLFGVFVGGLALNLTPCIYPLIPITVSYFGGKSRGIRGQTIFHGLLYILGLAFTNSILGVFASLSGGMLGSALQNPIVLIVVAGILVSLGLSFFGLWEIRVPSGLTRVASKNFGGYFGTFFMGLTLGIVAAPCLGPFILGLLTYVGQKGDPFLGFLYFFVLSIGLGLPLAILAIFSGALEKLPVSGAWMVWIRKVLGWVLVGMAAYLLQPLMPGAYMKSMIFSAILVAAGLHLGWMDKGGGGSRTFEYIKKGLGVILICSAISFYLGGRGGGEGVPWTPYSEALLAEAAQENKPVMLDFYADWCGPCKAMERNVFTDPEIVDLSRYFVTLRVDLTKQHPDQKKILKRYMLIGVPTIVFINSKGLEERGLRIEAYTDRDEVLRRMKVLINKSGN